MGDQVTAQRIIPPGFGLPNFKPSVKERMKKEPHSTLERPGNSEAHLVLLRLMPCVITLTMPAGEVHHLQNGTGERGTSMRSTDRWGLPMLHRLHMELHKLGSRREPEWLRGHGIEDPLGLANALWHATGDLPRMIKIMMAHRR